MKWDKIKRTINENMRVETLENLQKNEFKVKCYEINIYKNGMGYHNKFIIMFLIMILKHRGINFKSHY